MSKNTNLSFLTDYITADITNGRIGINNASPAYAFDVTGIARTSTSTYLATASGNVGIGNTNGTVGALNVTGRIALTSSLFFSSNLTSEDRWEINVATPANDLYFSRSGVGERMRITSTGNVGIGVSSLLSPGGSRNLLQISNGTNGAQIALGNSTTESNNARIFSGQYDLGFAAGVTTGIISFYTNDTERMRISSNGNIGIGTTSTPELVNINSTASCFIEMNGGSSSQTGFIFKRAGTTKFQWVLNNDDSLNAYNYMSGTNALRLTSGGNTVLSGNSDNGYRLYVNGTIYATGNITANSDLTLKKNLVIIDNPTDKLMQLNGYSYQWKSDDSHQYGVIAQEVEKILPYAVSTGYDGIKGVSYNQIIPVLIEAVKEQQSQIEELKTLLKA